MRPALLALLLAAPASAAFEDLGAGARAPGMANAFTALADDVHAVAYNPAGLAQLERPQAAVGYARLHMGLSDGSDLGLSQLAYAHPLKSGRWGVLGVGWDRFALDSVYAEQTLALSWGRLVYQRPGGKKLLAGLSAKRLTRSFTPPAEAYNARNGVVATGQPDPVLTAENERSAMDFDLGLLWRMGRRVQLGLQARHLMRPDVGFAGPDRLPMDLRLGAAYKALWLAVTGELRQAQGPSGAADRDVLVGAERWFPTLTAGSFGLRGGFGLGTRQWRQLSAGLSYRVNKIQVDYAFLLPLGAVDTAGTHRFTLGLRFGAPAPEDEITQGLLQDAERLREGKSPELGQAFADAMRPRDLGDPALSRVRALVEAGRYREAHAELLRAAEGLPRDEGLSRLGNRLGLVSYYYAEQPRAPVAPAKALERMIGALLWARDREAVLFGSYALSMAPNDAKLDNFLRQVEEGVRIPAERLPPAHPRGFLQEILFRVEAAHNRGENERVLALLEDVRLLEPENVRMNERLGSTYFVLGRAREAIEAWERALPKETDPVERRALAAYIAKARQSLGLTPAAAAADAGAAAVPARGAADPREVERLYQKGVEHFARGERLQATAAFMRVLQLDPDNAPAQKALERLRKQQ